MAEWMSAGQAAAALHVSPRRVRELVAAGALQGQQLEGRWLIDARAVRSRAAHAPPAGRPLSPAVAWRLLAIVQSAHDDANGSRAEGDRISDRLTRYRLRQLLAQPASPQRWARWLSARAGRRRMWTHAGVLDHVAAHDRVHPGGAAAAAALGLGSAHDAVQRFYLRANDVDAVVSQYRMVDDPAGQVELMVVPAAAEAAAALLARPGPVPPAVALADLLESDDARERHAAAHHLAELHLENRDELTK